jgi:hypothetical protein
MKSWKTTVLGVVTIVGALIGAAKFYLDGDAATNPDWPVVFAACAAGWGLIVAKDSQVTGGTISQ